MSIISNNNIARAIYLVSKDKKETELQDINKKIMKFIIRRRLLSKTPDILKQLDKIINNETGKIIVKILSSKKLEDEYKKELAPFLKERYGGKEIIFIETLDKKLLGGIRIEVNNEIIDLTAKNKIKRLQEHLIRKI